MLALLVGTSVLYVACGGTDHTFQEGDDDSGSVTDEGTLQDGTGTDTTGKDTTGKDTFVDDSPSSND